MKNAYVYLRMLQLLSKKELAMFKEYLVAQYCNANANAEKLFDILYPDDSFEIPTQFLKKKSPNEDVFSWQKNVFADKDELKEKLFFLIFGRKYVEGNTNLDELMTRSKSLLEDFLVFEELKTDKQLYNITLMEIFKNREGFDEFYELKAKSIKAKQWIPNENIKSISRLRYHFFYNQIDYGRKISVGKPDDESKTCFLEVLEGLNQYVITLYLKYSAEVLNRAEIFNENEITSENRQVYLLEQVLKLIGRKKEFYNVPVIFLYYQLVKCLLLARRIKEIGSDNDERKLLIKKELAYYLQLKKKFLFLMTLENTDNNDDLQNIYDAISNYVIRKMDKELHFMEDWSELTSAALKYKLINLKGGRYIRIIQRTLKTILHYYMSGKPENAVLIKQEMDNFIQQNKMYIPNPKKSEATLFVRGLELVYSIKVDANLRTECGKIAKRLNLPAKPIVSELSRRILSIQLFFRANLPTEELSKLVASTITFLHDHKEINVGKREAHLAFISCIKSMDRYRSSVKTHKTAINKIINGNIIPLEKEWLINEANNL